MKGNIIDMIKNMKLHFMPVIVIAIIAAVMISSVPVNAAGVQSNYEGKYVETRQQLNTENIMFEKDSNGDITISMNENVLGVKKRATEDTIEKLDSLMTRYEGLEDLLLESVETDEELVAISYTECPLELVDGHLQRIEKTSGTNNSIIKVASAVSGSTHTKYYLSLVTSITRGTAVGDGRYNYTCKTKAVWSNNAIIGLEEYPAAGMDYIYQTTPNTFARYDDALSLTYNNERTPKSGTDYSCDDGNDTYIKYSIADDPVGTAQMTNCTLTTYCKAYPSSGRTINSYYIHTWTSMSCTASIEASTDKAVSLSITPSISQKSWPLYSYVTFDF